MRNQGVFTHDLPIPVQTRSNKGTGQWRARGAVFRYHVSCGEQRFNGRIAQRLERLFYTQEVAGSIPASPTTALLRSSTPLFSLCQRPICRAGRTPRSEWAALPAGSSACPAPRAGRRFYPPPVLYRRSRPVARAAFLLAPASVSILILENTPQALSGHCPKVAVNILLLDDIFHSFP